MDSPVAPSPLTLPPWFQRYMYVVGVVGNLFFFVQAYTIFSHQSAGDVSLPAFCIAFWAVSSWFAYGLVLRNPVLICANLCAMLGSGAVVVGLLLYG